jgi:uncharacterized membrane protein
MSNIEQITGIEKGFLRRRSSADRLSDIVSRLTGSVSFILAQLLFVAGWILLNLDIFSFGVTFDRHPFGLLSLIVGIEAILLFNLRIDEPKSSSS